MADTIGGANVEISVDDSKARSKLKGFVSFLKSTAKIASGVSAGIAIFQGVSKAIDMAGKSTIGANADMETYLNTLTVVMKSHKKAAQTLAWAKDFANKTPFETDEIVDATAKLQSYGLNARKILPQIGDMSSVMGKSLDQGVEAIADAQTGELERLKEFGITKNAIIDEAEKLRMGVIVNNKGQITDQKKFNAALFALMKERYNGGMEMQSKTWKGMLSNIRGFMSTAMQQLSQPIFNKLESGLRHIMPLFDGLTGLMNGDIKAFHDSLTKVFGNEAGNLIFNFFDTVNKGANIAEKGLGKLKSFISGVFKIATGNEGGGISILTNLGLSPDLIAKIVLGIDNIKQKLGQLGNGIKNVGSFISGIYAIATGHEGKGISILTSLGLSPDQINTVIGVTNQVKQYISNMVQNITSMFKIMSNYFISAWSVILPYIKPALIGVFNFIKSILTQINTFWQQNGTVIMQAVKNVMTVIVGIIKLLMPVIAFVVEQVWGNVKGVIQGALNVIMGLIKIFAGLFTGNWSTMWSGVKQLFSGAIQFIWNLMNLMFIGRILKGVRAFGGLLKNVFSSIWAGIKWIWDHSIGAVVKLITGHWSQIEPLMTGTLKVAKKGVESFWSGIKWLWNHSIGWVISEVKSHWSQITGFFKHPLSSMKSLASEAWKSIVDGAKALPGKIGDGIKKMGGKIAGGINYLRNKMIDGLAFGVNGVIKGVNWVLKEVDSDKRVKYWDPPHYKKGTGGHPGGPFIAGDGGKPELIRFPDGSMTLSPAKDTLYYGDKGTEVLDGNTTEKVMSGKLPFYKNGVMGDFFSNIAEYVAHPTKFFNSLLNKLGINLPSLSGSFGSIMKGSYNYAKNNSIGFVKDQLKSVSSFGGKVTGKLSDWIDQAMGIAGVAGSAWKSGLAWIINHESSGNPNAVGAMTSDGTAKGLMQLKDFNVQGNPFNPLANIASGIKYIEGRYKTIQNAVAFWKKNHWYAKGTNAHQGGDAVLGDGGKPEPYLLPDGTFGISPNKSTLYPNLPKGTKVWSSMKDFMKKVPHYAKGVGAYTKASNAIGTAETKYSTKQISTSTYIATLKKIRNEYKLTAAQQNRITKDIYKANKALSDQAALSKKKREAEAKAEAKRRASQLKAEKSARDSLNKSILSNSTTYYNKIKSINDKLAKGIKSANDDYNKQLSDRANSIYTQIGLFDEPESDQPTYKQDLTYRLKEQLQTYKQFQSDIAKLNKKAPSSFVDELRDMGVGSASQIHALTQMSSKELSQYVSMWKQKHSLSNKEATIELEPLKKSTEAQIASLRKAANKELDQAKTDFMNKIKTLIPTAEKMGSLRKNGNALGKYAVSGLINGLKSMDGPLSKQAKSIAKTIEKEIRKTLKIHSPSRVTFSLGQFVGQGLHQGMTNLVGNVREAAKQLSMAAVPPTPSLSNVSGTIGNFVKSVNQDSSGGSNQPIFNFYGDNHFANDYDIDKVSKGLAEKYNQHLFRTGRRNK